MKAPALPWAVTGAKQSEGRSGVFDVSAAAERMSFVVQAELGAPYDRILATAAVDRVPPSWLAQTRPRGKILAPLRTALELLEMQGAEHAARRLLPRRGANPGARSTAGAERVGSILSCYVDVWVPVD